MAKGHMGQPAVRPRARREPAGAVPFDADGFGSDGDEPAPAAKNNGRRPVRPVPPEILACGPPPEDAAGIQKWTYRMLTVKAFLAAHDPELNDDERDHKFRLLTDAAARHYPEAARYDLSQKIERDAAELVGKKRARAAAKLETREPAGDAMILPFKADG